MKKSLRQLFRFLDVYCIGKQDKRKVKAKPCFNEIVTFGGFLAA